MIPVIIGAYVVASGVLYETSEAVREYQNSKMKLAEDTIHSFCKTTQDKSVSLCYEDLTACLYDEGWQELKYCISSYEEY